MTIICYYYVTKKKTEVATIFKYYFPGLETSQGNDENIFFNSVLNFPQLLFSIVILRNLRIKNISKITFKRRSVLARELSQTSNALDKPCVGLCRQKTDFSRTSKFCIIFVFLSFLFLLS